MANKTISGTVPFALPARTQALSGTELLPIDQTVSGAKTTFNTTIASMFGSLSITYPTGLVTAALGLTVAGGAFTSRGILDSATANALTVASTGAVSIIAPASGTALTLPSTASAVALTGANAFLGIGTAFAAGQSELYTTSTNSLGIGTAGTAALNLYTGSTQRVAINSAGAVAIIAPASGMALTVNGLSGNYTAKFLGGSTVGSSFGPLIQAGSSATDQALSITNVGNTASLMSLYGDGHFSLGYNGGTSVISTTAAGNVTISAPASGAALAVNVYTGSQIGTSWTDGTTTAQVQLSAGTYLGSTSAHRTALITSNTVRLDINAAGNVTITNAFVGGGGNVLTLSDGTTNVINQLGTGFYFLGTTNTSSVDIGTANTTRIGITGTGNVSVAAPSSGIALTVNGAAAQIEVLNGNAGNSYVDYNRSAVLIGRIGSADSVVVSGAIADFGISCPGGGLNIATGGSSASRLKITSTGGIVVGGATGGDKGAGTINCTGLFVNGTAVTVP